MKNDKDNIQGLAHQQVLNQSLDILRSLRGWRIVRRQLDKCGQEIFTLLYILLHFLQEDNETIIHLLYNIKKYKCY